MRGKSREDTGCGKPAGGCRLRGRRGPPATTLSGAEHCRPDPPYVAVDNYPDTSYMVNMAGSMDVVAELRRLRIAQGLQQKEVARRAGVAVNTLSRWECGRWSPTLFLLDCWAQALGVALTVVDREVA